ncbi:MULTISPECIES: protoporphyrinogen oxidase HemJ [Azospirillaceae]|uniref:protoporphyrinogen oxidase HemJ n=1 Tax=Azospirillaceae TaxID=2829815 RepID=UPI000B71731F|nr:MULTISPECIES: protoporphyrinogen oxidase HemJ [Azospirillaceae]MDG5497234.1 protoporphyrinogen oxidase HemJ [Niveispirillum sp. BGYR6]SNR83806.1 putative membrane protein [Azospirillum sp. RU38E]SNR99361.1 putative membrane protein [Azospirillum sp. RU37A]
MADYYLWIKALHVISVIAWMAAQLYLPRLFVYHCEAPAGSPQSETFKVMERRLLKAIMNPAMIATWVFGIGMIALNPDLLKGQGWLHAKLTLVLVLSGVHGVLSKYVRLFAQDANTKPQKFFRILNEVPTLLMIGIVILVIVRPF